MENKLKDLDPTVNVKELVALQVERLDDLRNNEVKRLEDKIDNNDKKYQIEFNAAKEAVTKSETATDKRFDAIAITTRNLEDSQSKLITRNEYISAHQGLIDKVDSVIDRINRTEGASGIFVTQTDLNTSIEKLNTSIQATLKPVVDFMNSEQGRNRGISSVWGVILGTAGFLAAIITMFFVLSSHLK